MKNSFIERMSFKLHIHASLLSCIAFSLYNSFTPHLLFAMLEMLILSSVPSNAYLYTMYNFN